MSAEWIRVTVHPAAKRDAVRERGVGRFEVWVKAKPVDGLANAAMLQLLARQLGRSAASLRIVRGHGTRQKLIATRSPHTD